MKNDRTAIIWKPFKGLLNKPLQDGSKNQQLQDNHDECTSRADKDVESKQFRIDKFLLCC